MSRAEDVPLLALDAGGTTIKAALVAKGALLPGTFAEIPVTDHFDSRALAACFRDAAAHGAAAAKARGERLGGVGVSIPGPFDYAGGRSLMTHKYQGIHGLPLRPPLWEGLGETLPIGFVHDSTAFLRGETWSGKYDAYRRVCGVILGTGLGCASLLDGAVFKNEAGGPGISLYKRPFKDHASEDYVSKRGIMARYGEEGVSVREIAGRAGAGEARALRALREAGEDLAAIVHPVLAEYGFECLVLGGQIAKSGEPLRGPVEEALRGLGYTGPVRIAERIDEAPLLGAVRTLSGSCAKTLENFG